jgi:serine/threonine-protein kinase
MDQRKYQRAQEIFNQVVDIPEERRAARLSELCAEDSDTRTFVLEMIEEDAKAESILDAGVTGTLRGLAAAGEDQLRKHSFGPYRLVRLLGEGGMGVVYLAEREDLGSQAAIKILRDSALSPMRRQRFAIEQTMLAQLNHPSIAKLYDADTLEDGTPYIVMEYVEGLPLTTYVETHRPSMQEMLSLFRRVCEAVQYAHSQAIIHRDLKPSNILVTEAGAVKLLDFGISKHLQPGARDDQATITGLRLLTPAYSAPEQLRGSPAEVRMDVYSLGVVLYQLLAQRLPFDLSNQTPGQIERIIEQEEPKPPSSFGKLVDEATRRISASAWSELDTLCLSAMHKDPHRRYSSVEALIRDLDHYLKSEPLEARPDSFSYRASKFAQRNWRGLAWATAATILLATLGGWSAWRISRERKATAAEAARSKQIQQFMLNLFNGSSSGAAPSEDLRVTTVLDRGVQEARALDQDPETQAELYETLAGIYQDLGRFDRADPLLASALELRRRISGPDSRESTATLLATGMLRLQQARPKEAESLARAALAVDKSKFGPDDPSTAKAMSALGRVLEEEGVYDQAIPLLQQAVKLQSGRPDLAPDLAMSVSALAAANYYTGRFATADEFYKQALAIDEKLYGSLHPRVANDFVDLGEVQHDLGSDIEAEKFYRQALAIDKAWYGDKHPDTAFSMMAVGQSLVYQKRYDEAAPYLEGSLATQQEIFGPNHPRVAMAFNQVGLLEERRGRLEAAERDFTRMEEINRSVYGDRHYLVGVAVMGLGQVYLDGKRYELAEKSFQGALERFHEKLPADHPYIGVDEQRLGTTLVLEAKYKQAETPLLDANTILARHGPQYADRLTSVRKDLATVYEHLDEPDKAETYLAAIKAAPPGN